jgi:NADPH:quinone reductase-like Zn-dependent oxidoreductase
MRIASGTVKLKSMKAVRLHGPDAQPHNLFYEDAPEPSLKAGDALVRVRGCAITRSELTWPEVHLASDGSQRPFVIPGHEVSGVIESVPSDVGDLKAGDEIYGLVDFCRVGAAAELVAVRAEHLALKPQSLTFTGAAAVPLAGLTAWQALFDHAEISKGQKILIHGAAGGVGSFAVQFARWAGAYIIATARGSDAEFVRELGADEVLDYEKTAFEEVVENADIVFDTVGGETLKKSWQVIRPGGTLVTVRTPKPGEEPLAESDDRGVRSVMFIVKPDRLQLAEIGRLIDDGAVRPIVDRVYALSEARSAFENVERGPNRGKIVLKVD